MSDTFIFIGRSGCGKGTQAKLLVEHLKKNPSGGKAGGSGVFYLETGERFREFFKKRGLTPELSKKIYEAGGLQPEFLAVWMWSQALVEELGENMFLVIDGSPRKLHEARILDSALKFYGRRNPAVVFINISRDSAEERLRERGRADDKRRKDIKKRLDWYETEVLPTLSFFRNNPDYDFLEINGEQSVEEVHREILSKIREGK